MIQEVVIRNPRRENKVLPMSKPPSKILKIKIKTPRRIVKSAKFHRRKSKLWRQDGLRSQISLQN